MLNRHHCALFEWNGVRLSVLPVNLSVRLSAFISAVPTGLISVKFDSDDFYEKLSVKSKFGYLNWPENVGHFTWRSKQVLLLPVKLNRHKKRFLPSGILSGCYRFRQSATFTLREHHLSCWILYDGQSSKCVERYTVYILQISAILVLYTVPLIPRTSNSVSSLQP